MKEYYLKQLCALFKNKTPNDTLMAFKPACEISSGADNPYEFTGMSFSSEEQAYSVLKEVVKAELEKQPVLVFYTSSCYAVEQFCEEACNEASKEVICRSLDDPKDAAAV